MKSFSTACIVPCNPIWLKSPDGKVVSYASESRFWEVFYTMLYFYQFTHWFDFDVFISECTGMTNSKAHRICNVIYNRHPEVANGILLHKEQMDADYRMIALYVMEGMGIEFNENEYDMGVSIAQRKLNV